MCTMEPLIGKLRLGQAEQQHQVALNRLQRTEWNDLDEAGPPCFPVHALDGIGENHTRSREACRNRDLEGIALHLVCNGDHDGEAVPVIGRGRQNQGGTPACLLVSRLRIEIDFDDVALIGNVCRIYHTSLPTGLPQSCSPCRFSRVTFLTSASSVGRWRTASSQM